MWIVYFVFAPNGELLADHVHSLERFRDMGLNVLVVCATHARDRIPHRLHDLTHALYWKGLTGYDFSAYTLGLREIARHSPGATACVLNDSIYGPFHDLRPFVYGPRWDLSGFTASSLVENHLQSYAFVMRDVTHQRLDRMGYVFSEDLAFDHPGDVVLCQETYFARVAHRSMSVGAWWKSNHEMVSDATLVCPFEMLDMGFPFLKKSLLGKHGSFQDQEQVRAVLQQYGHPTPDMAGARWK